MAADGTGGSPDGTPGAGVHGHVLALRAMSVSDMLDGVVRLLRATFGRSVLVVVALLGPYQLLSSLVVARMFPTFDFGPGFGMDGTFDAQAGMIFDAQEVASMLAWAGALWIAGLVIGVIVAAALVALARSADRGERLAVRDAIMVGIDRAGATLGATVLLLGLGIVALGGLMIVVVPLILLAPPMGIVSLVVGMAFAAILGAAISYLVPAVAVIEGGGPIATLRRSLWVVRHRFGRLLGISVLVILLVFAITAGVSVAFFALSFVAGPLGWLIDGVNSTTIALISTPLTTFAALLVYLDARIRVEAYDLELRARTLHA